MTMTMPDECLCCGRAESRPHLTGLLRCTRCGHVRADTSLSNEEIKELYGSRYFQGGEYVDYASEEPALRRNFARRARELSLRHPKGGRLFEIGAAYGFFLREVTTLFDASGCDISEFAASRSRSISGISVVVGDYLEMKLETAYDVICMWDTIEHLQRPDLYVAKALHELNPGGTLVFSTGDIGSLVARIKGPRWRLLHPPTHLHYFTADSVRALLERHGVTQVEIRYYAFWRSADAVARHILTKVNKRVGRKLHEALRALGATNFSFPLNTLDIMTVFATKPKTA